MGHAHDRRGHVAVPETSQGVATLVLLLRPSVDGMMGGCAS